MGCSQGGKASEFGSEIKGSSPFIPDLARTPKGGAKYGFANQKRACAAQLSHPTSFNPLCVANYMCCQTLFGDYLINGHTLLH